MRDLSGLDIERIKKIRAYICIVIVGILLAALSSMCVERYVKAMLFRRLGNERLEVSQSIHLIIQQATVSVESLAISYNTAANGISYDQFIAITQPFLEKYEYIHALAWIPRIYDQDRRNHEKASRAEGIEGYMIKSYDQYGTLGYSPIKNEYYPVQYIEPYIHNETTAGFDMGSHTVLLDVLHKARDTGMPVATTSLKYVYNHKPEKILMLVYPIYKRGVPTFLPEQRRENLLGYCAGVFPVKALVDSAVPEASNHMVFKLYEVCEDESAGEIYSYGVINEKAWKLIASDVRSRNESSGTISFAGVAWRFDVFPANEIFSEFDSILPTAVFVLVLVVFIVAAFIFKQQSDRNKIIQSRVVLQTKELQSSKEWAELLYNLVPSAIFTIDNDYIVTSWNRKAAELTGYSADEMIGKTCEAFCCSCIGLNEPCIAKKNNIKTKEGLVRIISTNCAELKDGEGNCIGMIECFEDITEREENETVRNEMIREDTQKERMMTLGRLAAGMAHEINNPAAAIKSDINLMKNIIEHLPDVQEKNKLLEVLERDDQSITRIANIVVALKGTCRPETWHAIDVNKEIDFQLTILHKAYKYRINIVKDYGDLPQIKSYSSEIGQVILNLLTNAFDAIKEKGEVVITTRDIGDSVSIQVKDNGSGISDEHKKNLFDPFFTTKSVGRGTGLGLSTSMHIAKRHKGDLYVAETGDHGTTFVFVVHKEANK